MRKLRLDLQMFGASASKDTSLSPSSGYAYTLTASFVENSTSTTNNTSNITVTAKLKANGTYWSTSYNSTLEIYWYDNKTDSLTLKDSITFAGLSGYYDSKSVSSTFNVTHKNDGTLSGYAKAVFTKGSTTSRNAPPSGNVSTNTTALTSIARASTISCTSPFVGDVATINISRADNSYTDTLTYTIGSLTGTIATRTSNTTVAFDTSSLVNDIYTQMGSTNTSVQGTITVQTYNGSGTSLGTNTATFRLYANENDCKPEISFNVITTDNQSLTLTGNNTTFIKDRSESQITYTITPKYGATITNKWVANYTDLPPSPVTNWVIGTSNFTMCALDSRNYQTSLTQTLNIINYFNPNVSVQAYRTSPTGSEIKAKIQGTFFNDTFGSVTNTLTLVVKYRIKGTSAWTTLRTLVENTDYKISGNNFWSGTGSVASDITLDNSVFDYQNTYDIAIFYQDAIVDTFESTTVMKGLPVCNWEDELFNVNGNLTVSDTDGTNPINVLSAINTLTTVSVQEMGSNANGNYIKYTNGALICYKIVSRQVAMTTAWSSLYEGSASLGDWAVSFNEKPIVFVCNNSGGGALFESMSPQPTKTSCGSVYFARPNQSSPTLNIAVLGIGTWK